MLRFLLLLAGLLSFLEGAVPVTRAQNAASVRMSLLVEAAVERRAPAQPDLRRFYRRRAFAPAWIDDGASGPAWGLLGFLEAASEDGLPVEGYRTGDLRRLLAAFGTGDPRTPADVANADVRLTASFLRYADHLLKGRVEPCGLHPGWVLPARDADRVAVLEALLRGAGEAYSVSLLRSPHPEYERLRQALAAYRRLAEDGGWPALPDGPTLERESRGARVGLLRERLAVTGDLAPDSTAGDGLEVFDDALDQAVRVFQARHGLEVDGRVGRATRRALNVPAEARLRQLELALERWRWLPADLGRRHVRINLAGCTLTAYADGEPALSMRVICGTRSRRTPVFTSALTELVLAPYWNVPRSIAVGEILPKLRRNASYLARHHMTLYRGGRVVNPAGIDWSAVTARSFPYQLRQAPGPDNPLGPLKFNLPNPYGIRLHGTDQPHLFARGMCTFSHGCLRMERPLDLALYALREDTTWTAARLQATIATWKETGVSLSVPIPIYVLYETAWVAADGGLHFREDVYGYDAALDRALRRLERL